LTLPTEPHNYQQANQHDQPPFSRTSRQHINPQQEAPQHFNNKHQRYIATEASPINFMRDFLGKDLDSYADTHIDKYIGELRKWEECEMKEWVDGANCELFCSLM
jgi:hypothetical protein